MKGGRIKMKKKTVKKSKAKKVEVLPELPEDEEAELDEDLEEQEEDFEEEEEEEESLLPPPKPKKKAKPEEEENEEANEEVNIELEDLQSQIRILEKQAADIELEQQKENIVRNLPKWQRQIELAIEANQKHITNQHQVQSNILARLDVLEAGLRK